MKKIFSLFAAVLFAGSMMAQEPAITIVFGNNVNSASPLESSTKATTVIKEGTDFVTAQPFTIQSGKCYYGDDKSCIRLGKSNAASKLKITLSDAGKIEAKKIVVNACQFNSGSSGVKLNVNSLGGQTLTSDKVNYSYEFETATTLESLEFEADKSVKIYKIEVYKEEEITTDPSIKATPSSLELTSEAASKEVALEFLNWGEVTIEGASADLYSDAECTIEVPAADAWISDISLSSDFATLAFEVAANETEEARTAYIKVHAFGGETAADAVVTIKQAGVRAVGAYAEKAFEDIEETDIVIITIKAGSKVYALSSANGEGTTADAIQVTVEGEAITVESDAKIFWNIVKSADGQFVANVAEDATQWLFLTSTAKGVRVGTGDAKNFVIKDGYLYNEAVGRHVGVYVPGGDWRCYEPSAGEVHTNIADETLAFYAKPGKAPTALDKTEAGVKATKTLVNGQLVIEKNGVKYNVLGARL